MNTVEAFKQFYSENPHVYTALVRLARQAKEAGYKKLGMKQLFEVLRWEFTVVTRDHSGFKLNNNYTAPYARIIMHKEPDLMGFFEIRGGDWLPDVDDVTPARPRGSSRRRVTRRPLSSLRRESSEEMRQGKPVLEGIATPRGVPIATHTAPSEKSLTPHVPKPRRRSASSKPAESTPTRRQRTPEETAAKREAWLAKQEETARANARR